jgi:hypothetical protein
MPEPSLTDWLGDLPACALTELLDRRPDVLLGRPPDAWCELRQDERVCNPGRILSVTAVE